MMAMEWVIVGWSWDCRARERHEAASRRARSGGRYRRMKAACRVIVSVSLPAVLATDGAKGNALDCAAGRGHDAGMAARLAGADPVSFVRLFHRMGGWIAYIPLLLCLLITLASAMSLALARQFDAEGREAVGEVRFKEVVIGTDSDGDETRDYYLTLDFETRAGAAITVERSVGRAFYRATDIGDDLPLWYLESRPERIELERGENRRTSNVTQVMALVFGLGTLVAFWIPARWTVAAVRARRYGALEQAEVTGVEATSWTVNDKPRYRLVWREASGREGKSLAYKRQVLEGFGPGAQIEVYQGLKQAWWIRDVGPRAGG